MEDLEYTTCLQFATELADEWAVRSGQRAGEPAPRHDYCPWVLQDEGEA